MKCLIAGNNVKGMYCTVMYSYFSQFHLTLLITAIYWCFIVLARAIHSLAKMGDELHIEPSPDGLVLKTVNSSKSAYGDYRFHLPFFLSFSCISENTVNPNDGEEQVIKCKLPMKVYTYSYNIITSYNKPFYLKTNLCYIFLLR